ncbi:hypothetical protein E6C76_02050 [Pseudothauera nasutitermitis]|uniref:Alpha/beta-hydrolase family protein n=1 Tax=Pseudothauera nasutitermitis TaxID=2565930 RepID=A0A4S4B3E3_9RHOO|nr:alpha/beta-hydrolase family protein [Pseudothauera nasutitermitis]THF67188.1 hypothetical protein E6C76_02050 [Pseudothauera nasutitermitis]
MLPPLLERLLRSLSPVGLILGTLFFAMSLTPSLVPRPFVMQGLLSGMALAAGYGIGVLGRGIWHYLELPVAHGRSRWVLKGVLGLICLGVAVAFLLQASAWQNSLRALMELPPVDSSRPLSVGLIATGVFALLLAVARLFGLCARLVSGWLNRLVPRRISAAAGLLVAFLLFWSLVDGVFARFVLNTFDVSFSQLDALIEDDVAAPADPLFTGSAESLIAWKDLGRQGRRFVAATPTPEELARFADQPVRRPLRVYAGLNSAETIEERVELAFDELRRAGGFERKVLVIVTPTGTGWVDPGAIDSVEYLHRGDVASVAVQYSYLPSWLSLLAQPDYGADTARALFQRVYGHWQTLPADRRPRLYLQGLSLGALNSQRSADAWDIVGDPLHGALWSGPPFRSTNWQWIIAHRNAGSPAWLPRFRDGALIRFANQAGALEDFDAPWGPLRIVYLQYASDPITFFDPLAFLREPEWLSGPRGSDVSPSLRWFPVVTMLQLAVDIAAADHAPIGYGHAYATEHYIDGWLAVSAPENWPEAEIRRLKATIGDLDRTRE